MICVHDIEKYGFKCNWTLLAAGIPDYWDRAEVIKFALDQCLLGEPGEEVEYLAGLSKDDNYDIDRTMNKLVSKERRDIENEKTKIQVVLVRKKLDTIFNPDNVRNEAEGVQELIELWCDLGCPPGNGKFFGFVDYLPAEKFYQNKYEVLYDYASSWVKQEMKKLM